MTKVVIELSNSTIMFRHGDREFPVNVTELPQETLRRIFLYGRRMFNDTLNSQKTLSPAELLARYKSGEFKRGGRTANPLERECKRIMEDTLRDAGLSSKDVTAMFKDATWRQVASKVGVDPEAVLRIARDRIAARAASKVKI